MCVSLPCYVYSGDASGPTTSSQAYDGAEILKGALSSNPTRRCDRCPGSKGPIGSLPGFGRGAAVSQPWGRESRPKQHEGLPQKHLTRRKMILTQCAVCATDLGLSLGKKCGRCSTRYCGPACQKQHWEEGGHDQLCKKIKKAGGAEQYHANTKYTEAVAVAAEKCADDTKGQTCYICTQALHWKTKEGLVRMCACRGTAGFAHVSCLAEQAKILFAEAEENNLVLQPRWNRWDTCSLCEQQYHGVVRCALGWACWKTYVGRPATDDIRTSAMTQLGIGLSSADHHEDALSVREAELSILRRLGAPGRNDPRHAE